MSLPRSTSLAPLLMMQHDRFRSSHNHNHKDIHSFLVHEDPQSANVQVMLDVDESEETNKDSRNEGDNDSLEDEQREIVHSWQEFEVDVEYDAESEAESEQEDSPSALASESDLPVLSLTPEVTRNRSLPSSVSLVPLLLMRRQHSKSNRGHTDDSSRQSHSHSLQGHHIQRELSPVSVQERLSMSASEGNEGSEREDEEQFEENSENEHESKEEYDAESEAEPKQREPRSVFASGPALSAASTKQKQSAGSDSEAHSLPSLREDSDDVDSTESDFNLAKLRQESLDRLSQAWHEIFERYGKDISELPPDDEIDLATGELIVDNGILRSRSRTIFGTLTKLGHDLKKPLAEERDRLKNLLEREAYEESESDVSGEYRYNEEEQWSSSEYDFAEPSEQVSENESGRQSMQSSLSLSSTSSEGEERDDLGTIWESAADEGSEPDSRSQVSESEASESEASESEASESEASKFDISGDENHGRDDRFYQFRDPQLLQEEEPWSSSECDSDNHVEQGYEEESEFPSSQASLSRSSASFEAASHFYRAEWRRAQMMPRTRALADALLFKQPLTTAVVPSSPSKRSFGSIVPSSPLSSTSSAQKFDTSVMPLSFSVKRRRLSDVDYDLSLMPELDEDYCIE
ncbi:hypothetical protein BGZ80_005159 [Entomortierella chlamydospora]|uniref:Uncharacterized protein n=1 Tax=Entomortierella chlamydospora TaxID=101097 RepID=A0A9P6MZN9_9FUNG|nr:hypothetical protein BGZ79_007576 [Entomortierella chlamydospora]KAG0019872.1 hypothetical protein BGZ80_005159 [Entomortierella chlamydospora]